MQAHEILKTKTFPKSQTPQLDLELLLSKALQKPREFIYSHPEYELTAFEERGFQELYQRRLSGEPIAYILGEREFWSLNLSVDKNVLIPRPETELLVEIVLQKLNYDQALVADLGTGSGAIALALARERPGWDIVATDISEEALSVAQNNAKNLHLENIKFHKGDWCGALPDKKFDAIVSNPPYIKSGDPHLQMGDVKFEPRTALESGDGLRDIKKIVAQAKEKLKTGGLLALEHGYDQSEVVQELLHAMGYVEIVPHKDLAGILRIVSAAACKF